ncbi:transglutaminase domain-containing protein [Myroides sp. LJL119]
MNLPLKENSNKWYKRLRIPNPWANLLILLLNILITIPIFIIIHQNIIDPHWPWQLDRILLCIAIMGVLQYFLHLLKTILLIVIPVYLLVFSWASIFGGYGFSQVSDDYKVMIYNMIDSPKPQDIILSKLLPFPNKTKIVKAVEYNNPYVRNFALLATTTHFKQTPNFSQNRQLIQSFAVFKEIRSRWNYVNDPKGREYIATASESLIHFSGDCEDYSVLMAASLKAIGATVRLIHTKGHMYPEMLIQNKAQLEQATYLIKEVLFTQESKNKQIFYHLDDKGQIWLNLDYTAMYPGGPFMSEEILGELTLI